MKTVMVALVIGSILGILYDSLPVVSTSGSGVKWKCIYDIGGGKRVSVIRSGSCPASMNFDEYE